jgi:pilus assembly protein CpaB
MTRRALVFALLMAAVGVVLLLLYQRRFELEVSGGSRIRVLAAVKVIPRGSIITEEMLSVREIPQAYFEDRMIRENERAKILGLRIGNTVRAQHTLLWTDLIAASDERRDLSSLVQPGSRAVSIRTSRDDAQLALIRAGDYVDVISTLPTPNGETRAAAVLLQKVLVLGTTTSIASEPQNMTQKAELLLTLSVTVPEAQLLALAMEKGPLMVALRNPDDPKTADKLPDLVSTSVVDSIQRGQIKGVRGAVAVPKNLDGFQD